jgi:hypothetical protein
MKTQLELMVEQLLEMTTEDTMIQLMAGVYDVIMTRQTKALDPVIKKLKNHKLTEVIITDKKDYESISSMLNLCGKTWNDGMPMDSLDPYEGIEADEYLVLCIYKTGVGYYGTKEKTDQLTVTEYAKL